MTNKTFTSSDGEALRKNLVEIMALNQKANDQSFKHLEEIAGLNQKANEKALEIASNELERRLAPLDKWPTKVDDLAFQVREIQISDATLKGKANQVDLDAQRKIVIFGIVLSALAILLTILNIALRAFFGI